MLSVDEIKQTFINTPLEENYNFLESDLVKLANAFINAAKPKIEMAERTECIKVVNSLNHFVAKKLKEIRERK